MAVRYLTPTTFLEQSAPATPASGSVVLYAKSDGLLYSKDDAGTETVVTGGGGGSFPLLAPNGLVSAPSYSFTNDADSGMFLNAVGDLRISVGSQGKAVFTDDGTNGSAQLGARGTGVVQALHGGVVKLQAGSADVTTTVPILAPNGAVGAPAFSFSGDPDTGIYQAAGTGTFQVAINGVEKLFINAGSLESKSSFLAPSGSAGTPSYGFSTETGFNTGFYRVSEGVLGFSADGTLEASISSTGLDVADGITINNEWDVQLMDWMTVAP